MQYLLTHDLEELVETQRFLSICKDLILRLGFENNGTNPVLTWDELAALEEFDRLLAETTTTEVLTLCKAAGIDYNDFNTLFNLYVMSKQAEQVLI
ncbi:MAG TPA: hypothetical protein VH186_05525 [Chloroflexia bacterium]|nr:hypothetical protein [Chloroflexia bacterium]